MTSTLHFPAKQDIISFFEQNEGTDVGSNPFLYEKEIIQTVAEVFAGREIASQTEVKKEIQQAIGNMNNLNLTKLNALPIVLILAPSLIRCANENAKTPTGWDQFKEVVCYQNIQNGNKGV